MCLWKGQIPWLRSIKMQITNDPASLERILCYIGTTVILNNMLIEFGFSDDANALWDVSKEQLCDIGDVT